MMKLRINDEGLSKVGAVLCGAYALISLLSLAISVFVYNQVDFNFIINSALNIIFYIFVCSYFLKGRSIPYYLFVAILCLLISDYVLPIIKMILAGSFLSFTSFSPSFFIVPLGLVCGLLYFIFLVLYRKKGKNWFLTTLIVVSSIMIVLALVSLGFVIYTSFGGFQLIFQNATNTLQTFIECLDFIFSILLSILTASFAVVYFMYSMIIMRERF